MCDDQQTTWAEEDKRLAKVLFNSCTPCGDERKSQLSSSTFALMWHGAVLLLRAENSQGLTKKFLYIQSAAFHAASKSRFHLLSEATWCKHVSETVGNLHRSILRNINCEEKSDMIMQTTESVKKMLIRMRDAQTAELNKIEIIQQNMSDKEQVKLQKKKIETVKTLNEKSTRDFSLLMYYIAKKCQSILGDSPCKFCIVGLGSLAKKEVTLYSEFNYVIVLEEDVQYRETYQEILEYFRWFAVIFQVIIIGLEETPITLVGVDSLNKFYDSYTPSGIALDKMMPLRYNAGTLSSVTRQEFEFIKPVSEMLRLWSLHKHSPIGLLYKGLVRNFCFVYGSEELFDEFSESAYENLFKPFETPREATRLASWSMNEIIKMSPYLTFVPPEMNSDSTCYHPISDSLFYIAKVFRWKCISGFEIISSLKNFSSDLGFVCGRSGQRHYIELALAVACEFRMKLYAIDNGSRRKVVSGNIFDLVEESCFLIALQQLWNLSRHLQDIRKYAESGKKPDLKSPRIPMNNGKFLESVLNSQLNVLERNKNLTACDRKYIFHNCLHTVNSLLVDYTETGKHDNALLERATRYLLRCPGYDKNETAMMLFIYAYIHQQKYREIIALCEKHFMGGSVGDATATFQLRRYQIKALASSRPAIEVVRYSEMALRKFKDPQSQLTFNMSRILFREEDVYTRQDLTEFVEFAVKENTRFINPNEMLSFLEDIFSYQFRKKWFGDAIETVEAAFLLLETKSQPINTAAYTKLLGGVAAQCYLEILPSISDSKKVVEMLSKVLIICILANFRKDCHARYIKALEYLNRIYKTNPAKFVCRAIDQYLTLAPNELSSLPYLKILLASYYKAGNPSTTNMSGSAAGLLSPDEVFPKVAAQDPDIEDTDSCVESPTASDTVEDEAGLCSNLAGDIRGTKNSLTNTVSRLNRNGKDAVDTDFSSCYDEVGPDRKKKSKSSYHEVTEMKNQTESYKQADSLQSVSDKLEQTLQTKSHESCGTKSGNICKDKMMNIDHAKLPMNSIVNTSRTPGNGSDVSDSTEENRLPICDDKLKSNDHSKSPETVTKIGSNSSLHERKNSSQSMVANGDQHVGSKNSREVMAGMEIVGNAPNTHAISLSPRSNNILKKDLQAKSSNDLNTNSECDVSKNIIENGNHCRKDQSKVCKETKSFRATSGNDVGTRADKGRRKASYNSESISCDFPDSCVYAISSNSEAIGGSHSNIDNVEQIAKMTSFNIDVRITRVGERTNVHLVVRERNSEVRANYDSMSSRSDSDIEEI